MRSRASSLLNDEGKTIRVYGVQTPVAAGDREPLFRALVEQSLVGIYMIQDGRMIYLNPRMAEIHGYTVDELLQLPVIELVAPEDRELFLKNSRLRLEGNTSSVRYSLQVLRKDGTRRHVEVHGTRIDFDGRPAILGSLIDVTDQQGTGAALVSAHERLQHLLDRSPAVIYSLRVRGDVIEPVLVSENITSLLGLGQEEVMTPGWWVRGVHPDDLAEALSGFAELQRSESITREYRIRHRDGHYLWVEDSQRLVRDAQGEPKEIVGVWADITKRKEMEIALRESEARARVIADFSPIGIFMASPEGRNLYCNRAVQEMFGVELAEILDDRWASYIHPDDRERVVGSWKRFVTGASPQYDLEARWLRADGGVRFLHVRAISIHDGDRLLGYTGTAVDITDRKRTEEALLESEGQFRTSFEMAVVGQVQADFRNGRMLRVNEKFCEITGYSKSQLLSMTFYQLNHPDEVAEDKVTMEKLLKGEETVFHRNKRYVRKDGTVIWVEVNAVLIRDSHGKPIRTSAVVQDITERKQAELALRAMNRRYSRQETAISRLTRIYSLHRGDLREILKDITEVVTETLEIERASVWRYGANQQSIVCLELFERTPHRHSEGVTLHREHFPAYFDALTESDIIDAHDAHTDPRTREFSEVYLKPLGINSMLDAHLQAEGNPAGVLCCEHVGPRREWTTDEQTFAVAVANLVSLLLAQSERLKLQEQLRQSQKMEAIGQLAGGVAHDFNNILGAIIGHTELARLDVGDNPPVVESLDAITQASRRATDLVRQILAFSCRRPHQRQPAQLQHVIREVLTLLRATVPTSIEFQSKLPKTRIALVDPSEVHQAVMNLGTNAWHAMGDKPGRLTIELSDVEVDADFARIQPELHPGSYVRVSVSDTGCGMDAATQARIFEPFYTTKAPGQGTGLGLSVVHGIMKNHEGAISTYSEVGKGTTFHLYFPALETEVPADGDKVPEVARGHDEQILFVDDEEPLANVGKTVLEKYGYRVTTCTNPQRALELYREKPEQFDLVITDYTMPLMNGTSLARELLKVRPSASIILTTGYSGSMTSDAAHQLGFKELLIKPNTARALAETVDRVLKKTTANGESTAR